MWTVIKGSQGMARKGKRHGSQMWLSGKESSCKAGPQETQVQFLDQEDPLEEEMATHSRILAWKIPWTVGPGGLQSMGSVGVGYD